MTEELRRKKDATAGRSSKAAPETGNTGKADLYAAPPTKIRTLLIYLALAAVLWAGWNIREEEYITAENGLGYYLGIAGSLSMLLLLLYPLRKKARFMRNLGPTKYWFRAHMILGVLGPVLIVFHANYRVSSLNSTVAFTATMVVASSGLIGRYLYAKVHYGLYGRQATLKELKNDLEDRKNSLVFVLDYAPKLQKILLDFDAMAIKPRTGFLDSMFKFMLVGFRADWVYLRLKLGLARALNVAAKRNHWSSAEKRLHALESRQHIITHLKTAIRVAEFSVYERLLGMWHIFHYPLFLMLVIVVVVHVLAVHMY